MRMRIPPAALALTLLFAAPAAAQTSETLMGDLVRDVGEVREKVIGLARALPPGAWDWRPGANVRSTAEVLKHVAADNYFLPAMMGTAPPAATGINGKDFKTTLAYEKRTMSRDEVIAELEKSFEFLATTMQGVTEAQLNAPLDMFGQKSTGRRMWLLTVTHLHEHLGQLIAYARSNNVAPPWSK